MKIIWFAALYAVGLAAVAVPAAMTGIGAYTAGLADQVPADALQSAMVGGVASYAVQAALLGLVFGAVLGSALAGHGRMAWILGGGWVFLALAYGVGQGGLAVAAANGMCWGVAVLALLAFGGRAAGR